LFLYFYKNEIKEKYLGNLTGFSWVLIQPVITLLIYWFVFDKIFQARISEDLNTSFIVYLALGFWPWLAFSEAVLSSINTIKEKSDLIGKVKLDLKTVVIAKVSAVFTLHLIGYLIVLIIFIFIYGISPWSIPLLILPLLQLYVFAIALSLVLSSVQVFINDVFQVMSVLMTMWFFMTPIVYSENFIPEEYRGYLMINPIYTVITFIHKAVLTDEGLPWLLMSGVAFIFLLFLYLAVKMFNKLAGKFEEFI
jgi:lipopolysaccharide transport system permease protein